MEQDSLAEEQALEASADDALDEDAEVKHGLGDGVTEGSVATL